MLAIPQDPIQFWTAFAAISALIAAFGTVAAFSAVLYQISNERAARRRDEQSALTQKRLAQARRISGWIAARMAYESDTPNLVAANLLNASDEPVYRVVVWPVFVQGAAPQTGEEMQAIEPESARTLGTLPPGKFVVWLPYIGGDMGKRPGVEVAFTDAVGRHWIRRGTGRLDEISGDPADHYGVAQPVDWQIPTPA